MHIAHMAVWGCASASCFGTECTEYETQGSARTHIMCRNPARFFFSLFSTTSALLSVFFAVLQVDNLGRPKRGLRGIDLLAWPN